MSTTATAESCPFCDPLETRIFVEGALAIALWDGYPVSPGHALIIPRRHTPSWFDATESERSALLTLVDSAKMVIDQRHRPDGYNIGVNVGAAAGQTVFHLHIHLIPRFAGDVADPRGGVRHVIPAKANYAVDLENSAIPDPGPSE
jgi:diadenosine tetraphosphate (Ap4A) HIT family hydrolase